MLERPPERDPAVIAELVHRWQRDRDERARDNLLRRFMPAIRVVASRWGRTYGVNLDDALQEASLGFLRALETFDPAMGSLETYLRVWVKAKVGRARLAELPMTVPVNAFDDAGKAARSAVKLRRRLGRGPTLQEIATEARLSIWRTEGALAARALPSLMLSMSTPLSEDEDSTIGDVLPADDAERPDVTVEAASDAAAARAAIDAVVATFTPRHREYFALRFGKGLPAPDCGAVMGFNRQRANQIEKKIVARLRETLIGNAAVVALLGREPAPEEVDDVDGLLLSTGQVEKRTGLTREVIIDMIGRGSFPRAVAKDGRGHRLWREAAVERWCGSRAAL